MDVATFDEIAALFQARIQEMVWCNMATVDTRGRPRSRIVQPVWEGATGWIGTHRHGLKAKHLAQNAAVSLAYIGNNIQPVYIDGVVQWADDPATKQYVWELSRTAPEPLNFDFTPLYQSAENPHFGVLKFMPRRIDLADMFGERRIWHNRQPI